jgi:ribonuclease HI
LVYHFRAGHRVYTDGAAVHVGNSDLAVAGSAAIQIIGEDVYVVCMRLDLELPQNAACAEYVAVIIAAEHTEKKQTVHVVSDSAVVIRSFMDTTFEGTHKVMYSGMWRAVPLIR